MAHYSKEEYEYKKIWRDNKNHEMSKNEVLTEEEHDFIAELHSLRHDMHCSDAHPEFDDFTGYFEFLNEINWEELPNLKKYKKYLTMYSCLDAEDLPHQDMHVDALGDGWADDLPFKVKDPTEAKTIEEEEEIEKENSDKCAEYISGFKNFHNNMARAFINRINSEFGLEY